MPWWGSALVSVTVALATVLLTTDLRLRLERRAAARAALRDIVLPLAALAARRREGFGDKQLRRYEGAAALTAQTVATIVGASAPLWPREREAVRVLCVEIFGLEQTRVGVLHRFAPQDIDTTSIQVDFLKQVEQTGDDSSLSSLLGRALAENPDGPLTRLLEQRLVQLAG